MRPVRNARRSANRRIKSWNVSESPSTRKASRGGAITAIGRVAIHPEPGGDVTRGWIDARKTTSCGPSRVRGAHPRASAAPRHFSSLANPHQSATLVLPFTCRKCTNCRNLGRHTLSAFSALCAFIKVKNFGLTSHRCFERPVVRLVFIRSHPAFSILARRS